MPKSNETNLNVILVDDEKNACVNLKNLLLEYVEPDINIAGIAYSTAEAEQLITSLAPDAVFLDIEMPNENAFAFLERIAPVIFEVIFVTAYDEYAIKAFKLNAIDYILKPISIPELMHAVDKLKEKIRYTRFMAKNNISYAEIANQVNNKIKQTRITLKGINGIEVVDFKDICFIEAQSSYSRIQFIKNNSVKEITMSSPLSDYEELLPNDSFYRIHRSYLLNCSHIKKIVNDGLYQVTIRDNIKLPVGRRRFAPLLEFLKSNDYYYE